MGVLACFVTNFCHHHSIALEVFSTPRIPLQDYVANYVCEIEGRVEQLSLSESRSLSTGQISQFFKRIGAFRKCEPLGEACLKSIKRKFEWCNGQQVMDFEHTSHGSSRIVAAQPMAPSATHIYLLALQ